MSDASPARSPPQSLGHRTLRKRVPTAARLDLTGAGTTAYNAAFMREWICEKEAMSDVVVRPVQTRRQKKEFLEFPWIHYWKDPNWIPPLRSNQKELVGYKPHPFYERNEVQTFLAYHGGAISGRIAAIANYDHIERSSQRRGFFGFFECVNNEKVAHALFDAARQWLAERDIPKLRGPANPSINYELGTLVEGFDSPATFMMTYNPSYYPRLIESYGFRKEQDLYAYWGHKDQLAALFEKRGALIEKIREHCGVTVRPLDKNRFVEEVEAFLDVFNRSLGSSWGFVGMTRAEVQHSARSLRWLMIPELALGAEIDGKLVGAVFALPDYNPRIKAIDGRLFPFGFVRLLHRKNRIKKVRLLAANVLPEYQLLGIGMVLAAALVPKGIEWGMEEAEFSWVAESNSLSRGALEKTEAKRIKTYRVYDWDP